MAKNLKNKKIKGDFVNGKIKESSLPDSINARISILDGTVEELKIPMCLLRSVSLK